MISSLGIYHSIIVRASSNEVLLVVTLLLVNHPLSDASSDLLFLPWSLSFRKHPPETVIVQEVKRIQPASYSWTWDMGLDEPDTGSKTGNQKLYFQITLKV